MDIYITNYFCYAASKIYGELFYKELLQFGENFVAKKNFYMFYILHNPDQLSRSGFHIDWLSINKCYSNHAFILYNDDSISNLKM